MKSSTFSLIAVAAILTAYFCAAALDHHDSQDQVDARNFNRAREQCGNSDWTMIAEGEKLTITCIRRKPLNGGRVKP